MVPRYVRIWRCLPRGRITVTPVVLSGSVLTPETSTPLSNRRSTQNFPSGSPPTQELKPTRLPSIDMLWAKMAEELPSVIEKSEAKCSRSGSSVEGRPYRIRSALSSPTTLMSKLFTTRSPFRDAFDANGWLEARHILLSNACWQCRQTVGRSASDRKREAAFEGQTCCSCKRQTCESRIPAANC